MIKKCNFKGTTKINVPAGNGVYKEQEIRYCELKQHVGTPYRDTCDGENNCILYGRLTK